MKIFDRFSMALSTNLRKDGEPDEGVYDQSGRRYGSIVCEIDGVAGVETFADDFEYVMHGKVFKQYRKPGETEMFYYTVVCINDVCAGPCSCPSGDS